MKKIIPILFALFVFISLYSQDITIGNQRWMPRNLDVSQYRNGDTIRHAVTDEDWIQASNQGEGAWCYYNNDSVNGAVYGKLYNWFAVNDWRGLSPDGYHVPSKEDWLKLEKYLGGTPIAGGKIKESDSTHWLFPNKGATNESGFTCLPGGKRTNIGKFYNIKDSGYYWTSTEHLATTAWDKWILFDKSFINSGGSSKGSGFSVRCLKDR